MSNAEAELAGFFKRYAPQVSKLGKALRAKLRERLSGATEVVYLYENQKALVISYSPTGRGYDAPVTLGLYPDGVRLYFGQGAQLAKSDPGKLLQGSGKTVRYVALGSLADFERAEVQALMATALKLAKFEPDGSAEGKIILKAEEQKQRATRAKKAPRATAKPSTPKPRR